MFNSMFTIGLSIVLIAIGLLFFSVKTIIITLLELLIIAELVRMLINFIMDKNHKVNVRYAIDGSIIYVLRDLYITITMFQHQPELWLQIIVYMFVIICFIMLRSLTITQFKNIMHTENKEIKNYS